MPRLHFASRMQVCVLCGCSDVKVYECPMTYFPRYGRVGRFTEGSQRGTIDVPLCSRDCHSVKDIEFCGWDWWDAVDGFVGDGV
jgi:hypothetical protein